MMDEVTEKNLDALRQLDGLAILRPRQSEHDVRKRLPGNRPDRSIAEEAIDNA